MDPTLRTLALATILVTSACGKTADEPPKPPTVVWAHSQSSLFKIDPVTGDVGEWGVFVDATNGTPLANGIYDIAISKDGVMYGVSTDGLYRIDYKNPTPKCTLLATQFEQFNALAFVPAGLIDAKNEVLVAASQTGTFLRIEVDATTGKAAFYKLGAFGGAWRSSGDLAGLANDGIYATITELAGGDDHLAVIDPKTGAISRDVGPMGVSGIWGMTVADGALYGFGSTGKLYRIDPKTARTTEVALKAKIPGGFYGAGP